RLDRFVLAKHGQPEQQLILQGGLSTTGVQDLQLRLTNCSLDEFTDLLPQQPRLHGTLSAEVRIAGTAEAPSIAASTAVREGQIAGQAYAGLNATVHYQDRKARLQLAFHQDEQHTLHADGSLPVSLGWAEGFRAAVLGDLDVTIRSDGLNLAVLNAFSAGAADDIAGTLQLDLRATGPADNPLLSGSFDLEDGRATVKALGLDVSPISLSASLSPGHIRISQLTAKAGDGSLSGTGLIALTKYWPQTLDLSLTADGWPVVWTHQYRVAVDSQLRASGSLTAPHLGGHITVREATLRPELSFLSAQPLHHDETIVVRPSADAPALADEQTPSPDHAETGGDTSPSVVENLSLDVALDLGRDTRLQHQNANITLGGGLSVSKKRDEAPGLAGVIQLARGWAGFQGRRFLLNRGSVTFDKETQLNPRLDILAQYEHDDYVIDAVVGGTAETPRLDLRSTPPLEQADILAVLLFGKPTSALNKGEEVDLQQEAVALTSGYAAATLGQSVSDALGLDTLGIDLSDLDFSGGQVGFGRALTRKTRISASQSIGGKQGQEVAIDYEMTPNLDLRTSADSKGSSSADIIWRKRY
ncbi:MAG: translocation/assembly module TamB, partial [Desulfurellaceae bacterium]|nr:translocation/assembly module TamB [Desulfurellaceae bacterium]